MARFTEEQVQLFLDKNLASVATLRQDGSPHVTPVWVDWDGENVVFNTVVGRAKERHLRRDPRVGLDVFSLQNLQRHISISGTAELTEEGAEEHIHKLSRKYRGSEYSLQPGERRIIVKVRPERVDTSRAP